MKHFLLFLLLTVLVTVTAQAQINVGSTAPPDSSAMLQISGTTKGFLPPRMTRDSMYLIHNPAKGLLIFNTSDSLFYFKRDSGWVALAANDQLWLRNGTAIYNSNTGNIGIGTTTPATALHVVGTNPLTLTGVQTGTNTSSDSLLTITNGLVRKIPIATFGSGSVSSVSVTSANGVSGTVATSTTTPAISLTLGAITPSSVAATGTVTGSNLSGSHSGTSSGTNTGDETNATIKTKLGPATTTNDGYLTSVDWNTFNNKASTSNVISSLNGLTATTQTFATPGTAGTAPAWSSAGSVHTLNIPLASATGVTAGLLSNADWNTFNNKASTTNSWSTTGNSGTSYANNFLGTTDSVSLRFRTSNTLRMIVDSLGKVGIGTSAPASNLTVYQSSGTGNSKGITLTGNSIGGANTGTGFLISLGYNATSNKQMWLGDADDAGNVNGTFARFSVGGNTATLDAVKGDNSQRRFLAIGVGADGNSGVVFGGDGNTTHPGSYVWDNGNFTIGNGYRSNAAPSNGLLVQGNVGIGTSTPATALHVSATTNPLTLTGVQSGATTDSLLTITSAGLVRRINTSTFGSGSVSSVSVTTANGVSGTVATSTATPAISLTLGAITPSSVAATGTVTGSNVSGTNTGDETNATIKTKLGPATSTTDGYLTSVDWNTFNNKASTTNSWSTTGNAGTSYATNFLGTTDNTGFKFRTNNTQRMLIDSLGNIGIGSNPSFSASPNQEKLLVDAGTTNSFNVISGKGNINNYIQLNIQNSNAGTNASSDIVATADNGNETSNYVDLGINSSANTANFFGAANDAYLYAQSQNMLIGTASAGKSVVFLTGGGTQSTNERMRIDSSGRVGIGTNSPATALHVVGTNPLTLNGVATGTNTTADSLLTITSGLVRKLPLSTFGSGSVTSVSVANANGLAGTVANAATTPAITLTTTVTGMVKGNGTALSAATSGTDYAPGTAANSTGIVKSTTGTGALTTATASDFPTLNQNTTGTAANITGVLAATSHPALTGDVTNTAGSVSTTISNNAVTNAKLATMAANTFKANNTGATANATDITATQATAMLNTFTSTTNGLVPSSGGGTANFLRADGTFAVPAGTGLSSLNGLTATTQTFATPGTTGTAPAWSSSGSAHTLNIPLASATGVTAGLLSNTDWNTFNNKASTTNSWSTTGNAGTTAGTNFIGTTDAQDIVLKANNTERFRIVNGVSAATGTTGDITIGDANSGTLRSTKEMVLREDGDQFGSSALRLRNRNGQNGAIFENLGASGGAYLVDFIFNTGASSATQISSNLRFETRSGNQKVSGNTSEWQIGQPDNTNGGATLVVGAAGTGSNSSFRIGKVGFGTTSPTAVLHIKAGTATANTAPLKLTSGTNLTTPEDGAVEYDGTNYFATQGTTRYTLAKTLTATATLDFASTAATSSSTLTITVTGATDGDAVNLGVPNAANNANSNFTAYVSAANTVTVQFNNYSAAAIDPASATFRVSVLRY